jgi:hypothetical protein
MKFNFSTTTKGSQKAEPSKKRRFDSEHAIGSTKSDSKNSPAQPPPPPGRVVVCDSGHIHFSLLILLCVVGLDLGCGPRWKLPSIKDEVKNEEDGPRSRCMQLLQQALACSKIADMIFVFDDGQSQLSGHWGMLSASSEVFRDMAENEVGDSRSGEVRICDVTRESFKGLLEWMYIGKRHVVMDSFAAVLVPR